MAKKLNFNSPPVMRDDLTYKEWRADLEIWSDFTELDAVKQGGAVFLTLTGKAQQTVRAKSELPFVWVVQQTCISRLTSPGSD